MFTPALHPGLFTKPLYVECKRSMVVLLTWGGRDWSWDQLGCLEFTGQCPEEEGAAPGEDFLEVIVRVPCHPWLSARLCVCSETLMGSAESGRCGGES